MKKNIKIKERYTGSVIFEHKCNTILECIKEAFEKNISLRDADLENADLRDADLRGADLRGAKLRHADLRHVELRHADLRRADLLGADLRRANLLGADLQNADLQYANLQYANLQGANLQCANLDYSVMCFHCNHLKPKTDRRLCVQLAFHLASWMKHRDNLEEDEKKLLDALKPYANEFHKTEVERI